jgi:hypothetical protein
MAIRRIPYAHRIRYIPVWSPHGQDPEISLYPENEVGRPLLNVQQRFVELRRYARVPGYTYNAAMPRDDNHLDPIRQKTLQALRRTCHASRLRALHAANTTTSVDHIGLDIAKFATFEFRPLSLTDDQPTWVYSSAGRLFDAEGDMVMVEDFMRSKPYFPAADKVKTVALPISIINDNLAKTGSEALTTLTTLFPNIEALYAIVDPHMISDHSSCELSVWAGQGWESLADEDSQSLERFKHDLVTAEAARPKLRWRGLLYMGWVDEEGKVSFCNCSNLRSPGGMPLNHCNEQRLVDFSVMPSALAIELRRFNTIMSYLGWFKERVNASRGDTNSLLRVGFLTWGALPGQTGFLGNGKETVSRSNSDMYSNAVFY